MARGDQLNKLADRYEQMTIKAANKNRPIYIFLNISENGRARFISARYPQDKPSHFYIPPAEGIERYFYAIKLNVFLTLAQKDIQDEFHKLQAVPALRAFAALPRKTRQPAPV